MGPNWVLYMWVAIEQPGLSTGVGHPTVELGPVLVESLNHLVASLELIPYGRMPYLVLMQGKELGPAPS